MKPESCQIPDSPFTKVAPAGSPPYVLDRRDWREVVQTLAFAGLSAALVTGLEFLSTLNFGAWTPGITAVLTVLIKAWREWATDHRQP